MNVPLVDLKAQYDSIKEEIDEAMRNVIEDSAFVGGKYVRSFEKNFKDYLGVNHCIGVGNGTDALYIALKSLGIKEGDEVITAANSFIATSEAISNTGAKVVFVDCKEDSYNIDPGKIEGVISEKTRALVPVHLYGQPVEIEPILDIAQKYNLYTIEDAAQAHGAKYRDKKVGNFGDLAIFSFYPGKNLGAYGDGGAVVTADENLAKRVKMFANHGRMDKYNHEFEGVNSRLDGLQAAILDMKLRYLEKWNNKRRKIAKRYEKELKGIVGTPSVINDVRHVYHLYVIRIKNRDKVREMLSRKGISTGIHYPIPLPFLKAYEYLGYSPRDFPVVYSIKDEILSLPIHGSMNEEDVSWVIQQLKNILYEIEE